MPLSLSWMVVVSVSMRYARVTVKLPQHASGGMRTQAGQAFELRPCGCRAGAAIAVRPEQRGRKRRWWGPVFLVTGNMCCGITGVALMVRVGAESREQALCEPHLRPVLFGDRALSGFICIEPEGYAADDALASWVERGLSSFPGSRRSPSAQAGDPSGPPCRHDNLGPSSRGKNCAVGHCTRSGMTGSLEKRRIRRPGGAFRRDTAGRLRVPAARRR